MPQKYIVSYETIRLIVLIELKRQHLERISEYSLTLKQAEGIYIQSVCELKGHRTWNYRFDEDYTEEIKKYESTHNKS